MSFGRKTPSNGWGGRRVGAGRKPKSALARAIDGNAGHRPGRVLQHPNATTVVAEVETFDPPTSLAPAARAIWDELAPHAFTARTLTKATLAAFLMLCRAVVLEQRFAESPLGAGGPDHRGLMQRVSTAMKDFGIAPLGKPLYQAEAPAKESPLTRLLNRKRS